MRFSLCAALVLTLSLVSCKSPHSKQASLDNFAAGAAYKTNLCSGSRAEQEALKDATPIPMIVDVADKTQNILLRTEAVVALSAVPPKLVDRFIKMNGTITITPFANQTCRMLMAANRDQLRFAAEGQDSILACTTMSSRPSTNGMQSLDMFVDADADAIRHALVRQFGFFYAQMLSRMLATGKPNEHTPTYLLQAAPNMAFEQQSDLLASAFLRDIAASQLFDVANLKAYIGTDQDIAALKQNLSAKAADAFNGVTFDTADADLRAIRKRQFKDYVYAEAFDSYYCNTWASSDVAAIERANANKNLELLANEKNTRALFEKLFPTTFAEFQKHRADIESGTIASNAKFKPAPARLTSGGSGKFGLKAWSASDWGAASGAFFGSIGSSIGSAGKSAYKFVRHPVESYNRYYDAKYQQTTRVIENLEASGMSANEAAARGGLIAGVPGVQSMGEAAGGVRLDHAKNHATWMATHERVTTGIQGAGEFAGTIVVVGGAVAPATMGVKASAAFDKYLPIKKALPSEILENTAEWAAKHPKVTSAASTVAHRVTEATPVVVQSVARGLTPLATAVVENAGSMTTVARQIEKEVAKIEKEGEKIEKRLEEEAVPSAEPKDSVGISDGVAGSVPEKK